MSVTVYFANISKRRNSTLQGTFSTSYDCVLKAPTSLDRPTFLVSAASMDYNAAKMGDRYYFIDDVVSVRDGQWEVSCILDVLATYKADILASTQYVTYSSHNSSSWLPDTRIPILTSTDTNESRVLPAFLSSTGFYCLTVSGQNGCRCYAVTQNDLSTLISRINDWAIDERNKIINGNFDPNNPDTYDFSSVENGIKALSNILTQSGALGNAYQNAPQMIRSCLWLPLNPDYFTSAGALNIYLGDYDTGISAKLVKTEPYSHTFPLSIPWHYTDWRRKECETVYVTLPFAGVVNLPADSMTHDTSLDIHVSIAPTNGTIAYCVEGSPSQHIYGYFSGSCGADYAIGINQKSGLAEVTNTLIEGVEKVAAVAIDSSVSPLSMAGAVAGAALEGMNTAFDVKSVAMSTHPSTVGSMGGAAASGLPQWIEVSTVSHPLSVNPTDMLNTMGLPTMKPMSLATLTGFCQCANAHVAAAAQAREIDAIDAYLNSGFFIE